MEEFLRNCPQCGIEIKYKTKSYFKNCEKLNRTCKPCGDKSRRLPDEEFWVRVCAGCNLEIIHKNRNRYLEAVKYNKKCISCTRNKHKYENIDLENLSKNCPECGVLQKYKSVKDLKKSSLLKKLCRSCSIKGDDWIEIKDFRLDCPKCGIERMFSDRYNFLSAKKSNSLCKTCAIKETSVKNIGREFSEAHLEKLKTASNNPERRREHSRKITEWHKNNPGNDVKNRIYSKYSKDLADFYKKKGESSKGKMSGDKNPMYGRPSPNGAGNGWSGWYNGVFFRSLLELSYMAKFLSATGVVWESAETNKFKIEYTDWEGKIRNYFPDYFVNDKYLVEVKPKRLWNTPKVLAKKEAAEEWCRERGYEYQLIDCDKLLEQEILKLYEDGIVVFTDRYEKRFKERYLNNE